MHIAVCDDNVADRKQLERLLKRESDKRQNTSGHLYTESFGNSDTLIKNPMQYDLFFLDMTEVEPDGFAVALSLIEAGVNAPIVLCSSKIDYLEKMNTLTPCPSNLLHLSKAIETSELSAIIDKALELRDQKIPAIELRSETETYYVTEDDIVYAVMEGNYVRVHLADGRIVPLLTTMYNFFDQVSMYSHMVLLNEYGMFNIAYMKKYSLFKVTLQNGIELKSSLFAAQDIKSALQLYHAETLS